MTFPLHCKHPSSILVHPWISLSPFPLWSCKRSSTSQLDFTQVTLLKTVLPHCSSFKQAIVKLFLKKLNLDPLEGFKTAGHFPTAISLKGLRTNPLILKIGWLFYPARNASSLWSACKAQPKDCGAVMSPTKGKIGLEWRRLLSHIICSNNLTFHCYADDTQVFIPVKTLIVLKCLFKELPLWFSGMDVKIIDIQVFLTGVIPYEAYPTIILAVWLMPTKKLNHADNACSSSTSILHSVSAIHSATFDAFGKTNAFPFRYSKSLGNGLLYLGFPKRMNAS